MKIATKIIHDGEIKSEYNPISIPVYRTSTFGFDSVEEFKAIRKKLYQGDQAFNYTRISNPTCYALEKKIAMLENAEAAVTAGSGMGIIGTTLLSFLKKGDHILVDSELYSSTSELVKDVLPTFGVEYTEVDFNKLDLVKKSLKGNTKVVYFESPTNPGLKINDIQKICEIVHRINKNIKVIIDGTITSPYLQQPLSLGCDIVLHSLTKYINGHGDVVGGVASGKQKDIERIRLYGRKMITGSILSPDDAFLVLRGIKTLNLRMQQHCASALAVATYLSKNPYVKKVNYPGLKSHPNYLIAKKQMVHGFGGIISFETNLTCAQTAKFVDSLQLFKVAVSNGDPISLVTHSATMFPDHKPDSFVRFSIGLEDSEDLINDINNAFKKVKSK
ncbi:MAG: PLP-dependent aspartate aminotransferase family protein [Mycoplasmataceae bacterium]|jgi:methionine-gamma-lyase|nr:PLP-dependent aspartate aminotransferase family protein [Mycoplasmataceae bacterium]